MNGFYLTFKKFYKEDAVQAGMFLALILCLCFFSVIFLNKTLTSLQVPGVQGHGPYGYSSDFTHRALVDPGGSTWSPRPQTALISQQFVGASDANIAQHGTVCQITLPAANGQLLRQM